MSRKERIYDNIAVNGSTLYTLFDTGARNNYITREASTRLNLKLQDIGHTYIAHIGGKTHDIREAVAINGKIHGLPLFLHLYVVDNLGKDKMRNNVDVLFSIESMETWGIELDIEHKKLDLKYFKKEWTEF